MAGRTRVPKSNRTESSKWIKQYIYTEALNHENAKINSSRLAGIVWRKLVDMGEIAEDGSPNEDTIRRSIGEARKNDPLDMPWSLGSLESVNVSPEAIADLVKLWKWCFLAGRPLTVREAKWATRLRSVGVKKSGLLDNDTLLGNARSYAKRERVWEAMGKNQAYTPMDTADLDASLTFSEMGQKAFQILRHTISVDKQDVRKIIEEIKSDLFYEMGISPITLLNHELGVVSPDDIWGGPSPSSDGAEELYSIWIQKLSQGQKWDKLCTLERREIAMRLLEDIEKLLMEIDSLKERNESKMEGLTMEEIARNIANTHMRMYWRPSKELFTKVGFGSK